MRAAPFARMQGEDRPQPDEEIRESRPMQKDAPTEGGGVTQGDIRVPRHPEVEEDER